MIQEFLKWIKREPEEVDEGPYVPDWPTIKWHEIVETIASHVENHIIYLQLADGSFVSVDEPNETHDVIAVIVAYPLDNIERWETEVPARRMVEKLSQLLDRDVLHLICRDPSFNGCHYACIADT